jgi:hypothetical protein
MVWDGIERRLNTASFNGLDRRRPAREQHPEHLAHLKDARMLDEVRRLRRARFEYWDDAECLE